MTVGHCAAVGEGGEMNQETGGDAGWAPRWMGGGADYFMSFSYIFI